MKARESWSQEEDIMNTYVQIWGVWFSEEGMNLHAPSSPPYLARCISLTFHYPYEVEIIIISMILMFNSLFGGVS
jgi:hypothetical protein